MSLAGHTHDWVEAAGGRRKEGKELGKLRTEKTAKGAKTKVRAARRQKKERSITHYPWKRREEINSGGLKRLERDWDRKTREPREREMGGDPHPALIYRREDGGGRRG